MNAGNWAAIITSLIAVAGAWAASRNARQAAEKNAVVVSTTDLEKARMAAETEAYNRARKMDIETIERQEKELILLREQNGRLGVVQIQNEHLNDDVKRVAADNEELHKQNEKLRHEVRTLEAKVSRLEGRANRIARKVDPEYVQEDSVDYGGVDTNPYLEAQNGK